MPTSLPTSKGEHLAFDITIVIFVNQMFSTLYLSGDPKQRGGHVHKSVLQCSFKLGWFTEFIDPKKYQAHVKY
jgi:hypothetical protein